MPHMEAIICGWGSGGHAGYLEFCGLRGVSSWTPVCGEHWMNNEARVACRSLGYSKTGTIG